MKQRAKTEDQKAKIKVVNKLIYREMLKSTGSGALLCIIIDPSRVKTVPLRDETVPLRDETASLRDEMASLRDEMLLYRRKTVLLRRKMLLYRRKMLLYRRKMLLLRKRGLTNRVFVIKPINEQHLIRRKEFA